MKSNLFVVMGVGLFLSAPVFAGELSYSGLEFSVANIQNGSYTDQGKGVSLSYEIGSVLYVGAGMSKSSVLGDDQKTTVFGFGLHHSLSSTADIYMSISQVKAEIEDEYDGEVISDTGSSMEFGLRNKIGKSFELNLGLENLSVFDETQIGAFVGGHFYVAQKASLGLSLGSVDDYNVQELALRVYF